MDIRAVLVLLCMLCTQAPCRPSGSGGIGRILLLEIRSALDDLEEVLPNISCSNLNITELVGLKQQSLSAHHLPSIRCYMQELSTVTPELYDELKTGAQFIQDMEQPSSNSTTPQNCSLPTFEQELDGYVFTKCFLQLVENRLHKSKL